MNNDEVIKKLKVFILEKEKQLKVEVMSSNNQTKNNIVTMILEELNKEVCDENTEN